MLYSVGGRAVIGTAYAAVLALLEARPLRLAFVDASSVTGDGGGAPATRPGMLRRVGMEEVEVRTLPVPRGLRCRSGLRQCLLLCGGSAAVPV